MDATKPQLIFVWPYLEWGGAQIYCMAIMKVARADWNILVVLPLGSSPDLLDLLEELGIRYETIDSHLNLTSDKSLIIRLRRHYIRFRTEYLIYRHLLRFDLRKSILHIDFAPWQSWQLFCLFALRGANIFVTLHNALPNRPAWKVPLWKVRMKLVSLLPGFHIFASNRATKAAFSSFVVPSFSRKIQVTYTCVNPVEIDAALTADFDRDAILQQHEISGTGPVVLCVAQFIDRKGRWVFLDAAKKVLKVLPDAVFVWVTSGELNETELETIASYHLDDSFHLIPSRTVGGRHEVLKFFRIADIYALPSYVEGLPISLLEAMAMGVPSISTRINAIPEAIEHMETGVLIEPGNSDALANAIMMLARDDGLRKKLADGGRSFVMNNFDERVAAQIAIDAYCKALTEVRDVETSQAR